MERTQEARGEGAEGTKETQGGSPGAGTRKLGEWAAGSDSGKAGRRARVGVGGFCGAPSLWGRG